MLDLSEDKYVCRLDEATLNRAKEELDEDPEKRQEQLDTFRKWVKAQPHLRSRTDNLFLLRFLRIARFDQKLAGEVLDNFWTARTVPGKGMPEWFNNMDPAHPDNIELVQMAFAFPLPGVDDEGRIVAYFATGAYDPKKYRFREIIKIVLMSVDAKLREEEAQINGFSILLDFTGFSPSHAAGYTPIRLQKCARCLQSTYPSRHRSISLYNTPKIVTPIIDCAKLYMDEKIKKRLHFHKRSLESLHKEVPPRMLPTELGGTAGTKQQIAQRWQEELLERREEVMLVADPRFGVDETKRPKPSTSTWQDKLRHKFSTSSSSSPGSGAGTSGGGAKKAVGANPGSTGDQDGESSNPGTGKLF